MKVDLKDLSYSDLYNMYLFVTAKATTTRFGAQHTAKRVMEDRQRELEQELLQRAFGSDPCAMTTPTPTPPKTEYHSIGVDPITGQQYVDGKPVDSEPTKNGTGPGIVASNGSDAVSSNVIMSNGTVTIQGQDPLLIDLSKVPENTITPQAATTEDQAK